jgi:hypothetical protein
LHKGWARLAVVLLRPALDRSRQRIARCRAMQRFKQAQPRAGIGIDIENAHFLPRRIALAPAIAARVVGQAYLAR